MDIYYSQNKVLFKEKNEKIDNDSRVAVKHIEKIGK